MEFRFKTEPFDHQKKIFEATRDKRAWAYLMEMGTGKTKVTLDVAAWLYAQGRIDALVVVAPEGVHRNWITDEIPVHLPDWTHYKAFLWKPKKSSTKKHQAELDEVREYKDGLAVFSVNIDSVITPNGKANIAKFLRARRALFVIDESTVIKTPAAARTKTITNLGRLAPYRRILTGTLTTQGPFDAYSQFKFLGPELLGFNSFLAFKNTYGIFEKIVLGEGRSFEKLVTYKNIDSLSERIKKASSRVTKAECLDLPPQLYVKRYFRLTDKQRAAYETMRKKLFVEIEAYGKLTARTALAALGRLQQITCNHVTATEDHGGECLRRVAVPIDPGNDPRARALTEIMEDFKDTGDKVIVWARYLEDFATMADKLTAAGWTAYEDAPRVDGEVVGDGPFFFTYNGATRKTRDEGKDAFIRDPRVKAMLGNPASGGRGLTLVVASTVIYYSNSFSLEHRKQSEDRAHRIGQNDTVLYIDLVAEDTIDEKIILALRNKNDLEAMVTGDTVKDWI